jgi:death-on-curing protein
MPRSTYGGEFLHGDLFAMAAAYLFHLTRNHPFLDGNKRTGAAAALVFLDLHGIEVAATDDALYDLVIAVAKGDTGKDAVAAFLQTHSRRS